MISLLPQKNMKSLILNMSIFAAIKGLYSNQPAHSCKEIRDSGDSKGDGEYWIDPEKSGNPLKVYCDMTTDGGKLRISICNLRTWRRRRGKGKYQRAKR